MMAESYSNHIINADGAAEHTAISAETAECFYTRPGEPWRVYTAQIGELPPYRFVVVFARYRSKWLYSKHRERSTWETAGGHIELGETPYEAAKRELHEETGAVPLEIIGVFDYAVHTETEYSYGRVFYAEVEKLNELPESEMAETRLFDSIPDAMTYPQILPVLYKRLQCYLHTQNCPDEIWDVYDDKRNHPGRTHRRGDPMQNGDYHLVVQAWIQNKNGEFIITRRSPEKLYPLMWESTGGSAISGDDSLIAVIREIKEEIGLDVLPECGEVVISQKRDHDFCDIWLFRQEFDLDDAVLQKGETVDIRWAGADEIRKMMLSGDFVIFDYIEELFAIAESHA
jgi:nucleoside triphosphatase YtkD